MSKPLLPNTPIRQRFRYGYMKQQLKNQQLKQRKVSFSSINYVGMAYENYDRHTAYLNGNSQINEKTKIWFTGRTKANTKYNKNFQTRGEKNDIVGNYDCSEELFTSFN
ncbi:22133_t:CDS:1 [Racocetra persica]|uniref:22133_t:CDS:1 n=1 Tax=Racocetra persica TaxID=160502 RepID=A0ACA9PT67_9GLOM|nr:22133_t:CDS:1 [Racocetra persica]